MASPVLPPIDSPLRPDRVASLDFDLEGDILLTLPSTSGIARFRVNSNILCIASPVFRAMLGGKSQFRERAALSARASTSEPLELSLADDDPNALTVILRIIHLQYDWVPPSVNANQLYTIAVICDKYDMRQSLEVWLVKWISPLVQPSASPVSGGNWLFIAYAFGRKDLFSRLTKELILQCRSDDDGNLLMNGTPSISARRQQTLEAMIDCLHSIVQEYSAPDTSKCKCTSKQDACDDLALGFLIRTFRRLKIYPEASQIVSQAIQEFKTLLDSVRFPSGVLFRDGNSSVYLCRCVKRHSYSTYCHNCGSSTTAAPNGTSHADTCSPLLGYQGKIQDLVNSVKGLSYSDFVRINAPVTAPPPGVNLWDCLQYK
ncbi:hypothetical protein BGX38DRAFT_1204090 [Terfezia claveryi]|nr:hypothetical protein BGX38DRAFT_1204090 [Terfezia claveryi]